MAEMISAAGLRAKGWTPKLIEKFLGEPDKLVVNPHHRGGPRMRLYLITRVEAIESGPSFQQAHESAAAARPARSAAATAAAARKRDDLLDIVGRVGITVTRIPFEELKKVAIRDWEERKSERGDYDAQGGGADDATVRRWMQNYARHCLTDYDAMINELYNQVGKQEAYELLKSRVMKAIKSVYPELSQRAQPRSTSTQPMPPRPMQSGGN